MTRRKSEADQQQGGLAARERLDHCERRESYCYPRPFGKKKNKKPYRDTESMDRIRRMLLGKKVPLYVTALYYTV